MGEALCACGCGSAAPLAKKNDRSTGRVKGQPMQFVAGHGWRGRKRPADWIARRSGENSPLWKGGRYVRKDGYVILSGGVLEHRSVMAAHLGRPLTDEEVVHHIDNNPSNNDISNLMLFPNNGEHKRYHGELACA